jgi:hypothetical protein
LSTTTPDVELQVPLQTQPDDAACGPTCLHGIYQFYGDDVPLAQVVSETRKLDTGGTLDVFLANHALRRGYEATIYTYNLKVFDPSWFDGGQTNIAQRLIAQAEFKKDRKLKAATRGYVEFLALGGELRFQDLTAALLRRLLRQRTPILTGLSSTYLYRDAREYGERDDPDDIRGEPAGHFVVLTGYHREQRSVLVADPMLPNPVAATQRYEVNIDRLICSILLGILTYDANLLIIRPAPQRTH